MYVLMYILINALLLQQNSILNKQKLKTNEKDVLNDCDAGTRTDCQRSK